MEYKNQKTVKTFDPWTDPQKLKDKNKDPCESGGSEAT